MKTIAAVQIAQKSQLTINNIDLDEPRADEVLVKIIACGICHTDIMMQADNNDLPFLLGHEGSGIIEKVGSNIASFSPGDAVLLSYNSCGHCQSCMANRPYQCESLYEPFFLGYREDGTTHAFYKGATIANLNRTRFICKARCCA